MIKADNSDDDLILRNVYEHGQEHVLKYWDELDERQRKNLLSQLKEVDFDLLKDLVKKHINYSSDIASQEDNVADFKPPKVIKIPSSEEELDYMKSAEEVGKKYLKDGKVAVFIVAGGQGSRLGYEGPKGCFRISPIKRKTIFQLHCEKIVYLEKKYSQRFPLYIMTSDDNHEQTKEFFEMHDYFGLTEVHFFKQSMIPAVDKNGKLILSSRGEIFRNPNGHGGSIYALKESGALSDIKSKGIETIFYMQVDNVLVNLMDPVFLGYHILEKSDMSSKAVSKSSPEEKVGVLGMINGKNTVIEYSNLPNNLRYERNTDGSLKFDAGNIAIHCINTDFIERVYSKKLPYNKAFKAVPYINNDGEKVNPESPNAYKFEMFVFDALSMTENSTIMMVDRKTDFAPVKNKDGDDSPSSAKKMMSDLYKSWMRKAGLSFKEDSIVEISPLYAVDEDGLLEKLKDTNNNFRSQDEIYLE